MFGCGVCDVVFIMWCMWCDVTVTALKKTHLSTLTLSTAPEHATCINVPQLCYLVDFLNFNDKFYALQHGHTGFASVTYEIRVG